MTGIGHCDMQSTLRVKSLFLPSRSGCFHRTEVLIVDQVGALTTDWEQGARLPIGTFPFWEVHGGF